jgi:hypothetical protein
MGTFAGAANVDYRFLFADQGKQTSVYRFRLQKKKEKLPFFVNTYIQTYIYAAISKENGKHSPGDFL